MVTPVLSVFPRAADAPNVTHRLLQTTFPPALAVIMTFHPTQPSCIPHNLPTRNSSPQFCPHPTGFPHRWHARQFTCAAAVPISGSPCLNAQHITTVAQLLPSPTPLLCFRPSWHAFYLLTTCPCCCLPMGAQPLSSGPRGVSSLLLIGLAKHCKRSELRNRQAVGEQACRFGPLARPRRALPGKLLPAGCKPLSQDG